MMDVIEAIYRRHAVRSFTTEPVPREIINEIVSAAVHAPSAVNSQPWVFSVTLGRRALAAYAESARKYLLATMPADSPLAKYRDMLEDDEFDIFYGAPALIAICAKPDGLAPNEDCCLAAENLMLAACALGLGTCWIGFARPWLNSPAGKAAIGIPVTYQPVAPIILGHPNDEPPPTPRRDPEIIWRGDAQPLQN